MSAARTLPFRGTRFGSPGAGSLSLGIPAAAYPGRVATNSDLIVAVDQQQTTLLLPMGVSDLTATVLDPSSIKAFNLLSIDSEIVKTLGPPAGNVIPVSRGFDGTLPAAHASGAIVAGFIDAYHHNALAAEIEAIETALGPNLGNVSNAGLPFLVSSNYAFAPQSPGGSLTVGTNVITLNPVPKGVNGTDANHYLYISGGTGTAEAVLITGGTAVSGAPSGTVIVTCANAHSGAWTIATATGGAAEAMQSLLSAGVGGTVQFPGGITTVHAPLTIPTVSVGDSARYSVRGVTVGSSFVVVASDYSLSFTGVFTWGAAYLAGTLSDLTVVFPPGPNSTDITTYTHWPPAIDFSLGGVYGMVENFDTVNAWVSIHAPTSFGSGFVFSKMHLSGFSVGMNFPYTGYADFIRISDVYVGPNFSGPNTGNNTAAWLKNAIGLNIVSGYFAISNLQVFAHQYASISGGFVDISNAQMDSGGLHVTGGIVNISGGYCTLTDPVAQGTFPYCVQASGGQISITNQTWQHASAAAGSYVLQDGQCQLSLANIAAQSQAFDVVFINVTVNNSSLTVNDVTYTNGTATPAGPFILMSGSNTSVVAQGNIINGTTNAAARFLKITGGAFLGSLNITGNQAPGWLIDSAGPSNAQATVIIGQNNGLDSVPVTIASASAITLPWGPKVFNLTGTAPIGVVSGLYEGQAIFIIPSGVVTFNAGATIGNTVTTVANVPLSGIVFGGKIYLH